MSKLHVRYAAMNAGKSTLLLQIAHTYNEKKKQIALFTWAMDDRYGVGQITSRIGGGVHREALVFGAETDFAAVLDAMMPLSCVLIDECQFLTPEQAQQLHRWAHTRDVPVMCFGLRTDAFGDPFPGAAMLMCLADDIEEIRTICDCESKATMQIRLDDEGQRVRSGPQVSIGGNNRYRPVCGNCFYFES